MNASLITYRMFVPALVTAIAATVTAQHVLRTAPVARSEPLPAVCGRWVMDPPTPILQSGEALIDYVAASDPHVIIRDGVYYLYYTGAGITDEMPDEVRTRLCLATSTDGITFERHPDGPILDLAEAPAWDSFGMETVFVLDDGDTIMLYYQGYDTQDAAAWLAGEGITLGSIGLAVSTDGIQFQRIGSEPVLIPTPGYGPARAGYWDCWAVEGPWVIKMDDGSYRMYYGAVGSVDDGVTDINGVGVAFSNDGVHWTKYENNPIFLGEPDAWDAYHAQDPCVIVCGDAYQLWYHGGSHRVGDWYGDYHIGWATSPDGLLWERFPHNPVLRHGQAGSWSSFGIMAPCLVEEAAGETTMYFHGLDGYPDFTNWSIGRAVRRKLNLP